MFQRFPIPKELEDKVQRELDSGERIEWIEQPVPRYFTIASIGAVLFGIPWTGFAIFWICGASGFKLPDFSEGGFSFFPLFGIPFVLVGLAMLSTPFWVRRKALKTVYVITDRRAITFDGGWGTTVRSYPPEKLQNIHRKDKRGDIGDVILDKKVSYDSDGRSRTTSLGFMNIREPKSVEDLLEQLAAKASQTKAE